MRHGTPYLPQAGIRPTLCVRDGRHGDIDGDLPPLIRAAKMPAMLMNVGGGSRCFRPVDVNELNRATRQGKEQEALGWMGRDDEIRRDSNLARQCAEGILIGCRTSTARVALDVVLRTR